MITSYVSSSTYGFKDGNVRTVALAGHHPGPPDETGSQIVDDVSVEVRHDHYVELLGPCDQLETNV